MHGIPRTAVPLDRSEQARERERKQIEQYKQLEADVVQRIKAKDYSNATFQLTSTLLVKNPEYYTIWNHRRLLLLDVFSRELATPTSPITLTPQDDIAAAASNLTPAQREISLLITEDLHFLIPLLRQYPKCYWIWNHRAWLLATATMHLPAATTIDLWKTELGLVSKMLGIDSRNFHGWGYRRKVVVELERLTRKSMAEREFEYTTTMIRANLSNFSAWHARSQLIPRVLDQREAGEAERKEMMDAELELVTEALYTDPYDQSLWFYHQCLMSTLEPASKLAVLTPCMDADRLRYLGQELDSIVEMMEGAEDCKYIYQALLEYTPRYLELVGQGAGEKKVTREDMKRWLAELRKIDPLREGRWVDLEMKLGI